MMKRNWPTSEAEMKQGKVNSHDRGVCLLFVLSFCVSTWEVCMYCVYFRGFVVSSSVLGCIPLSILCVSVCVCMCVRVYSCICLLCGRVWTCDRQVNRLLVRCNWQVAAVDQFWGQRFRTHTHTHTMSGHLISTVPVMKESKRVSLRTDVLTKLTN